MIVWWMHSGCVEDLRSDLRRGDSLACRPGPIPCRGAGRTFALGFGRLSFSLRGAGVPDEFTKELELGQEELPDYIPTKQHEEQRTHQSGHNDQQCEPDTLPHLSRTAAPAYGGGLTVFGSGPHRLAASRVSRLAAELESGPGRHKQTAAHRKLTPARLLASC